jgi:hypothetical protein
LFGGDILYILLLWSCLEGFESGFLLIGQPDDLEIAEDCGTGDEIPEKPVRK